ncbi:hypothetical protein F5878DRAFT_672999 [Lentinula raphanica]|uniref:Uncharacterized protein n=1 Tax=Lentinula raphanica TaxID=153919 RepID=A0AA38U3P8_9AGAR|nr:hypothetical protein F5878DRAFT_672999 [Lentinula raphanica]
MSVTLRTKSADIIKIDRHVQLLVKAVLSPFSIVALNRIYLTSIEGFAIGTGCERPHIVHIPVDAGLDTFMSIDDLKVNMYLWVSNTPVFKECSENRYHVDRFPSDASTALKHPYTFFFEDGATPTGYNKLVRKSASPYNHTPFQPLHGNVVVVKHSDGRIVNMVNKDWDLVKVILEWLVEHRSEFSDTVPHCRFTILPPSEENAVDPVDLDISVNPVVDRISSEAQLTPQRHFILLDLIWNIKDLRWTIFENTGVVTLFSLGKTCPKFKDWVQEFYSARVTRMLSHAFPPKNHLDFFDVLDFFEARIGGSAAYTVVDPRSSFKPSDLNILTPYGNLNPFKTELMKNWNCVLDPSSKHTVRRRFDNWARLTVDLISPLGFRITITESYELSLLPLMLAGYSTAECVLLGGHTFTLLYPTLAENGEVMRLPSSGHAIPEEDVPVKKIVPNSGVVLDTEEVQKYSIGVDSTMGQTHDWYGLYNCKRGSIWFVMITGTSENNQCHTSRYVVSLLHAKGNRHELSVVEDVAEEEEEEISIVSIEASIATQSENIKGTATHEEFGGVGAAVNGDRVEGVLGVVGNGGMGGGGEEEEVDDCDD